MRTLSDIDVSGKKVLVRSDMNVPLRGSIVLDDARIKKSIPTIQHVLDAGGIPIVASHLGRPKAGEVDPRLRMAPVAKKLESLLGRPVRTAPDCVGPQVKEVVDSLQAGDVLLLENVRFAEGEEKNDPEFAKALASLADIYLGDAFGAAHRAHASVVGVPDLIPSAAGKLMQEEVESLSLLLQAPDAPFVALLGGAKVRDKAKVIEQFFERVNEILIGGAMAFPFLVAKGISIGDTEVDEDSIEVAKKILTDAEAKGISVQLPSDHRVSPTLDADAAPSVCGEAIPAGMRAGDIGPGTVTKYTRRLEEAKTIFWNGPMGIYEIEAFSRGTKDIAIIIARMQATKVVGGGDSAAAVASLGLEDLYTHVSTGGGAALEFLQGATLPGVQALGG